MTDCVTPPAQGDWYDLEAITNDVLARLRLRQADVDRDRVKQLVLVAAAQINLRLDRAYPMTPIDATDEDPDDPQPLPTNVTADILDALRNTTIELYLRRGPVPKDAVTVGEVVSALDAAAPDLEEGHRSRWGLA